MILAAALVIGFALGWWRAKARQGNLADRLQYGTAHGIAFLLLALLLTVIAQSAGLI